MPRESIHTIPPINVRFALQLPFVTRERHEVLTEFRKELGIVRAGSIHPVSYFYIILRRKKIKDERTI